MTALPPTTKMGRSNNMGWLVIASRRAAAA